MSKHIKLEDAIHNINLEVVGRKEYTGDMKANLFFALDDLPTIEVSEDCISREYMLRALNGFGKDWQEDCEIAETIRNAPSVVPRLDKEDLEDIYEHISESYVEGYMDGHAEGEWIYIDEPIIGNPYGRYRCSECEMEKPHKTNYCPNCGAKMKV